MPDPPSHTSRGVRYSPAPVVKAGGGDGMDVFGVTIRLCPPESAAYSDARVQREAVRASR